MVLRVDPDEAQAQLLSFPRDLWVTIPDWGESEDQRRPVRRRPGGADRHHRGELRHPDPPLRARSTSGASRNLVDAVDGVPIYFDKPLRDTHDRPLRHHARAASPSAPDQALAYARSRHLEYREDGEWTPTAPPTSAASPASRTSSGGPSSGPSSKGMRNPLTLDDADQRRPGRRAPSDDEPGASTTSSSSVAEFRSFNDRAPPDPDPGRLATTSVNGSAILALQDTEANERRLEHLPGRGRRRGRRRRRRRSASIGAQRHRHRRPGHRGRRRPRRASASTPHRAPATPRTSTSATAWSATRSGNEAQARFVAAQIEGGADVEEVDSIEGGADVAVVTGDDYRRRQQRPPAPARPPR